MDIEQKLHEQSSKTIHSVMLSFRHAWNGIKTCWQTEHNFRIHVAALAFVVLLLVITHAHAVWWAELLLASGAVISAELMNTALEKLIDHLHPDQHETLKTVKDTMAGAVLVICVTSVAIFVAFLAGLIGL